LVKLEQTYTSLGPTHPPTKWVPWAPSQGLKQPGYVADYSPPTSAEVKNSRRYTFPQYALMAWYLVKHRDNFISYFYLETDTF